MKRLPVLSKIAATVLVTVCVSMLSGCATRYVTPGAPANLEAISDYTIEQRFETKPAATFPARIAVARVQAPDYEFSSSRGQGSGRFSVVTTRDIEKDEHFEKLASLPQVAGLATVNRLLLPDRLESVKDIRLACASLHADMLLLYTLDTGFNIKGQDLGPLTVVTLGFLPNKTAYVTTTASAVLYDVRTGHVYGLAEASHTASHLASTWSEEQAIDNARLETEKEAFSKLIDEFVQTWDGVLKEYAKEPAAEQ
jgi:hypothetical protein